MTHIFVKKGKPEFGPKSSKREDIKKPGYLLINNFFLFHLAIFFMQPIHKVTRLLQNFTNLSGQESPPPPLLKGQPDRQISVRQNIDEIMIQKFLASPETTLCCSQ